MMKSLSTLISISQPSFVWGGVGIGKSEMIHSVGESLGYQVRDVRVALLDPVDLRGVPSVEDGVTKWNPPVFLPTEDEPKTLLFLDELPHGSPSVQNALFQLVKDRKLGEYTLPDSTVIVGAGNRIQDRAGANRVNTALGDRFIHLNLDVDADEWVDWAKESGRVIPEVIAYIRYRPENLFVFDTKAQVQATPRSWEYASRIMATSPDSDIEQELYNGDMTPDLAAKIVGSSVEQVVRHIKNHTQPLVQKAAAHILAIKEVNEIDTLSGNITRLEGKLDQLLDSDDLDAKHIDSLTKLAKEVRESLKYLMEFKGKLVHKRQDTIIIHQMQIIKEVLAQNHPEVWLDVRKQMEDKLQ